MFGWAWQHLGIFATSIFWIFEILKHYGISWNRHQNADSHPGAFFEDVWIFFLHIVERIAQKPRIIILLHLRLVTFRKHVRKTLKPFMFMVFRFSDVSRTLGTNIHLWRHQETQNKSRKESQILFEEYCLGTYQILETEPFGSGGKDGSRQIPKICLMCFWTSCRWDQHLPEHMEWTLVICNQHIVTDFWNIESLKLLHQAANTRWFFETSFFLLGNPPTSQYSDSHPFTSP